MPDALGDVFSLLQPANFAQKRSKPILDTSSGGNMAVRILYKPIRFFTPSHSSGARVEMRRLPGVEILASVEEYFSAFAEVVVRTQNDRIFLVLITLV